MKGEEKYASMKFIITSLRLVGILLAVLFFPKAAGIDLVGWIISADWRLLGFVGVGFYMLASLLEFLLYKYGGMD